MSESECVHLQYPISFYVGVLWAALGHCIRGVAGLLMAIEKKTGLEATFSHLTDGKIEAIDRAVVSCPSIHLRIVRKQTSRRSAFE